MAMAATRKSATAAISLIKATAVVKLPHIRFPIIETPNFLGSIRSMSQIYSCPNRPAGFGFNLVRNSIWPPLACTRSVSPSLSTHMVRLYRATPKEILNLNEKRNIRDCKRRFMAQKYEVRRRLYKALCSDPSLPIELREKCRTKLSKLPRDSSFTRVRNRCIISGRTRGVYSLFRMSRIEFRGKAKRGELMGVTKASW